MTLAASRLLSMDRAANQRAIGLPPGWFGNNQEDILYVLKSYVNIAQAYIMNIYQHLPHVKIL